MLLWRHHRPSEAEVPLVCNTIHIVAPHTVDVNVPIPLVYRKTLGSGPLEGRYDQSRALLHISQLHGSVIHGMYHPPELIHLSN